MEHIWGSKQSESRDEEYMHLHRESTYPSGDRIPGGRADLSFRDLSQIHGAQTCLDDVVLEMDDHSKNLFQTSFDQDSHGTKVDILEPSSGSVESYLMSLDHPYETLQSPHSKLQMSDAKIQPWLDMPSMTGSNPQVPVEDFFHNNLVATFDGMLPMSVGSPVYTQARQLVSSPLLPMATPSPYSTHNQLGNYTRTMIGSMYSTNQPDDYVFECTEPQCYNRTFARWYDFKRHYDGAHAATPTEFWCPVSECDRSVARGGRPFPRKDRMREHVRKMHGAEGARDI